MNKPLINYYARLILRGDYKFDEVPEDMKELVQRRMNELKPVEKEDETKE